jgi:hypothetical protein
MQRRSALAQEERRRSKIVPKPLTLDQREPMSAAGHSRPMHSVPVSINVRCCTNGDIIVRRSEVTRRANSNIAPSPSVRDWRSLVVEPPAERADVPYNQ